MEGKNLESNDVKVVHFLFEKLHFLDSDVELYFRMTWLKVLSKNLLKGLICKC